MDGSTAPMVLAALGLLLPAAVPAEALQAPPVPPDEEGAWLRIETSPRHAEWVGIDAAEGDRLTAWVVHPERPDAAPVVILVHETLGVTEWVRAVADQLAEQGFLAVAPDLLSGREGTIGSRELERDEALRLVGALPAERIRSRLDATARWSTELPSTANRVAVMGFCWGGEQAFRYVAEGDGVDAAVVFYGAAPDTIAAARIRTPVLGLYAEQDARVNESARRLLGWMGDREEPGWTFEHREYEGAGHGFLRLQSGHAGANRAAADQAWRRAAAFLHDRLEPEPGG